MHTCYLSLLLFQHQLSPHPPPPPYIRPGHPGVHRPWLSEPDPDPICTDHCVPGCQYPRGTVLHGNRCVLPKSCKLLYKEMPILNIVLGIYTLRSVTYMHLYLLQVQHQLSPHQLRGTRTYQDRCTQTVAQLAHLPLLIPNQSTLTNVLKGVSVPEELYWMGNRCNPHETFFISLMEFIHTASLIELYKGYYSNEYLNTFNNIVAIIMQ